MSYKIGLLLPKSVIYPSINFDLIGGMRTRFADMDLNVEIKTESIGIGGNDKEIYAQCEKLLMEGVAIIAGYVNPTTAEKLVPLFTSGNALFIALDAGYHFPSSLNKPSSVFYISLQGALCCRVATALAVADGMKNIAYTASYYEAGYRSAFAFHKCLEESGGAVTFNHITKLKRADFTLVPLQDHLKDTSVDAVFASFCGDMLLDFYTTASETSVFEQHPVYGAPFMGEEQWLEQTPYPGRDIKTCVTWASGLNNAENEKFTHLLTKNKQKVNVFSLLGWEAATVIATALNEGDNDNAIVALEGLSYSSPRGMVHLDADTHQCHAPVYDALVQKEETTGNCKLMPVRESENTEEQRQRLENDIRNLSGSFTSWLNTYPCLDS